MKKVFALAVASLFSVVAIQAQTKTDKAEVQWGPDMDIKTDGQFGSVMDDVNDAVFLSMSSKKEWLIQRMDGLKVSYQKPVEMEMDKDDLSNEGVVFTNENVIIFTSLYDKKAGVNQLYASIYDQAGFGQLKRFEKVASISAEKSKNPGQFGIYTSPDRSKVLVALYQPEEKDKEAKEKFELQVYDNDLQQLWAQQVALPYEDDLYGFESLRLDNDGSVLMLGTVSAEKREGKALKREGKPSYEYHLLTFKRIAQYRKTIPSWLQTNSCKTFNWALDKTATSFARASSATKAVSVHAAHSSCVWTVPQSRSSTRATRSSVTTLLRST
jgi:hypothetical protein